MPSVSQSLHQKPVTKRTDGEQVFAINLKASFVAAQEMGKKLLELKRPGKARLIPQTGTNPLTRNRNTDAAVRELTDHKHSLNNILHSKLQHCRLRLHKRRRPANDQSHEQRMGQTRHKRQLHLSWVTYSPVPISLLRPLPLILSHDPINQRCV